MLRLEELADELRAMPSDEAQPAFDLLKDSANFARVHCDVIREWGRFPHRFSGLSLLLFAQSCY